MQLLWQGNGTFPSLRSLRRPWLRSLRIPALPLSCSRAVMTPLREHPVPLLLPKKRFWTDMSPCLYEIGSWTKGLGFGADRGSTRSGILADNLRLIKFLYQDSPGIALLETQVAKGAFVLVFLHHCWNLFVWGRGCPLGRVLEYIYRAHLDAAPAVGCPQALGIINCYFNKFTHLSCFTLFFVDTNRLGQEQGPFSPLHHRGVYKLAIQLHNRMAFR